MRKELLEIAAQAVASAKAAGAQDAFASANRSRQVEFEVRNGKLEKVQDSTSKGLALKLYVDGYLIDTPVDDMAAPATFAAAGGGRGGGAGGGPGGGNVQVTPIARGLWRITGGTMVIVRIYDPVREDTYRRLGLTTVCPTTVAVGYTGAAKNSP